MGVTLTKFLSHKKNPKFLNVNTLLVATSRMLPSSPFFNRIMCEQCRQNRLCSTVCHFGFSKYSMRVTMVFFELFELSIVFWHLLGSIHELYIIQKNWFFSHKGYSVSKYGNMKKLLPNFMMSWIWYWVILYVLYTKIRCSGFEPQI